jgi:hypothetical protein
MGRLLFAEWTDVEDLVFVEEMGTNVSLSPIYAWSRRGERAHAKAPRNWGKIRYPALASITAGGLGPCLAVEEPTTREVFETYPERVLAPALRPGQRPWWTTSPPTRAAG